VVPHELALGAAALVEAAELAEFETLDALLEATDEAEDALLETLEATDDTEDALLEILDATEPVAVAATDEAEEALLERDDATDEAEDALDETGAETVDETETWPDADLEEEAPAVTVT